MRSLVWSMIVRFNGSYAPRGSGSVVPSVNCTDDLPTQRIRRRFTIIARPTWQNPSRARPRTRPAGVHRIIPVGVHRHIITAHVKIADVGQRNTHQPFRALQIKAPGIAAHARDRLVEHVEQLGRIHRFHQVIERFDVVSFGDVIRIPVTNTICIVPPALRTAFANATPSIAAHFASSSRISRHAAAHSASETALPPGIRLSGSSCRAAAHDAVSERTYWTSTSLSSHIATESSS